MSVYAHARGSRGTYHLAFELRAATGDVVWRWRPAGPLHQPDPRVPTQVAFSDVRVVVDEPGRYDLVLLAAGDDIASQPLLIGPAEVFRAAAA